ncbi:hypothetical protein MMUR_26490 [Mycolicibacterium murale]|uniref:Uncharacterized protein n=1 Tax=Mycolicibacterium murale TaxID=182220 RepID=A0A7I9WLI9_9MYCO|nr:hypothetical protein MMUR_26490 [Mycolicibacterium murale]
MQRRVDLIDLDFGNREALPHGAISKPAREERLAGTVFAAHSLEYRTTGGHHIELSIQLGLKTPQPDGKLIEPVRWHCAPA